MADWKQHKQLINEPARLCSEETLFMNTESEFHIVFMCHKIFFYNFFQAFQMQKLFLALSCTKTGSGPDLACGL